MTGVVSMAVSDEGSETHFEAFQVRWWHAFGLVMPLRLFRLPLQYLQGGPD